MTGTIVLRLVRPFGDAEGSLAQLHLETSVGSAASSGVVLCALASPEPSVSLQRERVPVPVSKSRHVTWVVAAFFALGILAAVATMR